MGNCIINHLNECCCEEDFTEIDQTSHSIEEFRKTLKRVTLI